MDTVIYEVRINKTKARPRSVSLRRFRKWRYDVTKYRPKVGQSPGVYDCREHLGSTGVGYCFTKIGASIAAGRRIGSSHV